MTITRDTYSRLTALLVDDHAIQRQQLRWHLAQLGIDRIDQAGTAQEALNQITRRSYDLVLCDYNLDTNARGIVSNGQQLLEHIRTLGVMGPNTIFVMVSGNNNYKDIAATVEQKPDAYLVKPITTKALEERLQRLIERQMALSAITSRQRAGDHNGAVAAAGQVMAAHPEYTLPAMQMKGGSQLELAAFDDALVTFEQAIAISAKLDWAQYGKARALKGLRRTDDARLVLKELVARNSLYTSAYEMLAAMAEEEGNDAEAMAVLQRSIDELPSPRRSRALADAAYRAGDVTTARRHYETVMKATKGTFVARGSDVLMLAQSAVDLGDHKEALKLVQDNMKMLGQDAALEGVAFSLQAQAYSATGDMASAKQAAASAKTRAFSPTTSLNTMLMAKGLLAVGDSSGLDVLKEVVKGDHENAKMLNFARKVLKDTGNEAQIDAIVDAVASTVRTTIEESQKLRRSGDFMQAKHMVDRALTEMPHNTGVLIEAAQVYLLALARQERKDSQMVGAVSGFLDKLEELLPGSDRVTAQRAYFRRVLSSAKP